MSSDLSDSKDQGRSDSPGKSIDDRLSILKQGLSDPEISAIEDALSFDLPVDPSAPKRPAGVDVAVILKKLGVDPTTLVAAILSDSRLQSLLDISEIESKFGASVANLVQNVRWLNTFNVYSPELATNPNQAEILRRMLLAMVDDVRAVLIKLAFRVERLRNLAREDYEVRLFIARETLDIYAKLANRLGIRQLKWELEDLAFRYLNPQVYKKLANLLSENRAAREAYLVRFVQLLNERLQREGIEAEIYGRPKHIYSIWKKMQRKQTDFKDVYDLRAVRVIVDKVSTCYSCLGVIHGLWQYVPQEFDDYIANPKTNGYQSLHTVVVGPEDALVEIQIRTREMDQFAEYGVAAHWLYKEGGKPNLVAAKSVESLRRLLDNKDDDHQLLDHFRSDLYTDRIFVLTPKSELKELPRGSTPLDFAYTIHTEVGHRCRGAKVNRKIVPLSYTLKTGEQIEILTGREAAPSRSWLDPNLGYLKTPSARAKVRQWFRKQNRDQNIRDGKSILDKICQSKRLDEHRKNVLLKHFHLSSLEELFIALGRADISVDQISEVLQPTVENDEIRDILSQRKFTMPRQPTNVIVEGVDNLLINFAKCCKPVHGDPIVGFISGQKGLLVHRDDCKNITNLSPSRRKRVIGVSWGDRGHPQTVAVLIHAVDRTGLLKDITQILSNERINILAASTRVDPKSHLVKINLSLEVLDLQQLNRILEKIGHLPNVVLSERYQ